MKVVAQAELMAKRMAERMVDRMVDGWSMKAQRMVERMASQWSMKAWVGQLIGAIMSVVQLHQRQQ